jgi:hypothetical protein
MPFPPFRESTSWIISTFKFWTATIFLHAHLQVVYYKCVKFHKNPISHLGEVVLTRYMVGQTDGRTGWFLHIPMAEMRASPRLGRKKQFWASKILVTRPNGIMVAHKFCDIFFIRYQYIKFSG